MIYRLIIFVLIATAFSDANPTWARPGPNSTISSKASACGIWPYLRPEPNDYQRIYRNDVLRDTNPAAAVDRILQNQRPSRKEVYFLELYLGSRAASLDFEEYWSLKSRVDTHLLKLVSALAQANQNTLVSEEEETFLIWTTRYFVHTAITSYFAWNVDSGQTELIREIDALKHVEKVLSDQLELSQSSPERPRFGFEETFFQAVNELNLARNFLAIRQGGYKETTVDQLLPFNLSLVEAIKNLAAIEQYVMLDRQWRYLTGYVAFSQKEQFKKPLSYFAKMDFLISRISRDCDVRRSLDLQNLFLIRGYKGLVHENDQYWNRTLSRHIRRHSLDRAMLDSPNQLNRATYLACLRSFRAQKGKESLDRLLQEQNEIEIHHLLDELPSVFGCKELDRQ